MRSYFTGWVREVGLWFLVGCGTYLIIALITYAPQDPGWSYVGPRDNLIKNAGGAFGAWSADVLFYLFGYIALLFPAGLVWFALLNLYWEEASLTNRMHILLLQWAGFVMAAIASAALADAYIRVHQSQLPAGAGGVFGQFTAALTIAYLTPSGGILALLITAITGFTIFSAFNWLRLMEFLGWVVVSVLNVVFLPAVLIYRFYLALTAVNTASISDVVEHAAEVKQIEDVPSEQPTEPQSEHDLPPVLSTDTDAADSKDQNLESQLPLVPAEQMSGDTLPPMASA